MATKALTTEQAQEAIDTLALHNGVQVEAAKSLNMHPATFRNRLDAARRFGLMPDKFLGVPKVAVVAESDEPVIRLNPNAADDDATDAKLRAIRSRIGGPTLAERAARRLPQRAGDSHIGTRHIVIPDVQTKEGVPQEHLEWVGNYITEKQPDVIVMIGDWADMPSLSVYDKGKLPFEGRRYVNDIEASRRGMERMLKPIDDYNRTAAVRYEPRKVLTLGNHEHRIQRTIDNNPEFAGKFMLSDLGFEEFGWEVIPFLVPIEIDGVEYCHYFTSGVMGRPVSSAAALLRARQRSATMGHVQSTDIAMHQKTQQTGMFCGTCYLHDEEYLGPQGNVTRRQIVVKNEVRNGVYDPMLVSLAYLKKRYS